MLEQKEIDLNQLKQWQVAEKAFQLIDVRETSEHSDFNIGGQLIPFADVGRNLDLMARDRPVVLYCKRGIRSAIIIQRYANRNPDIDFYNLKGGIQTAEGLAIRDNL